MTEKQVDELFVGKPMWTSETKIVGIEIPDFLMKIEGKENINSPHFKLSGVELYLKVKPGSHFISVFLWNGSKEDQTTSFTLDGSGVEHSWKMKKIAAKDSLGFKNFLSIEKFKTWAKNHGDVFKLKATLTLHKKRAGDDWIRYYNRVSLSCPLVLTFLLRSKSREELELTKSLRSEATISVVNKAIMLDKETADFTVSCESKSFKVHKSFLCSRSERTSHHLNYLILPPSRSPVLRTMILGKMKEAQKNEVFIEDIDGETLSSMISFIYTGDFEVGDKTDVQMVARAADKYDINGFLELLCFKMKTGNVKNDLIADMLITADRHNSKELRDVALDKLRAKRSIINEDGFRKRMKEAENMDILFDLFNDL